MTNVQQDAGFSATSVDVGSEQSSRRFASQLGSRMSTAVRWSLALALLLLVASGAAAVLAAHHENVLKAREVERHQILADLGPNLVAALSYDYRHMDRDLNRALSGLTPRFGADYRRLFQTTISPTAAKYRGVVTAELVAVGLESSGGGHATVLAFVDQTTTTRVLPAPRVDASRVQVKLLRVDGKWRIDAIDPV